MKVEIAFRQMDNKTMGIRLDGSTIMVGHQDYGSLYYPVKNSFNYQKSCEEYPEIEGKSSWREILEEILIVKLKNMKTTKSRVQYIINEMVKQGNTALYWQREGHRPQRIDGNIL